MPQLGRQALQVVALPFTLRALRQEAIGGVRRCSGAGPVRRGRASDLGSGRNIRRLSIEAAEIAVAAQPRARPLIDLVIGPSLITRCLLGADGQTAGKRLGQRAPIESVPLRDESHVR